MELRLEKADGQIPRFSRVGADVASPIPQLSRKFMSKVAMATPVVLFTAPSKAAMQLNTVVGKT